MGLCLPHIPHCWKSHVAAQIHYLFIQKVIDYGWEMSQSHTVYQPMALWHLEEVTHYCLQEVTHYCLQPHDIKKTIKVKQTPLSHLVR